MKITKRQLRRIIKEEASRTPKEKFRLTENQLRSKVRREILSSMGNSAPVVYEGFLSDMWEKIKGGAEEKAIDTAAKEDVPKDKAEKEIDASAKKMDSADSTVAAVEKMGSIDAWTLVKAMHGMGTDEETIRKVLLRRSKDLAALSKEYTDCLMSAEKTLMTAKGATKETITNMAKGAIVPAAVLGTLGAGLAIASLLNPVTFFPSAAAIFGHTTALSFGGAVAGSGGAAIAGSAGALAAAGAGLGAKVGLGKDILKKISGLVDNKINPEISLADALEDEGMDEEAEMVRKEVLQGA